MVLALQIDETARRVRPNAWRGNQAEENVIKAALMRLLRNDPADVERMFLIYRAGTIRLNTDLARKAPECLEYVVVHELVHLLEPHHNERFVTLMDRFLPGWRLRRDLLNRLPVRHEEWTY